MYRFDEDFDGFLEDFGEPHDNQLISEEVINTYRNKLPDQLLTYWKALGSCGFHNGLIWMVNPEEYQDLLDSWLEGSPFQDRNDLSVIARTAFGVLYVWGKGKGNVVKIHPTTNLITYIQENDSKSLTHEEENFELRCFWGLKDLSSADKTDNQKKPLFSRALKKLGKLKSDEIYGFSHRLSLGGKETLENLEIFKLDVYHDLAQQMESPQIIKI